MAKPKKVLLIFLIFVGVALVFGLVIPIVKDGMEIKDYETFDNLSHLEVYFTENVDTISVDIQDEQLGELVPLDSFCCQYKYKDKIYILYAHQFDDLNDSRQYFYNYTKKNSNNLTINYSLSTNTYFHTELTSYENYNVWHIEGDGVDAFDEMYDNLLKIFV